ncbi:TIGR03084 family protein [bacterium]|nr:TIGR03084 family protein [bacterium]
MKEICNDLREECQALDDIVAELDDESWSLKTSFYDWTIKDEIAHLAYFDYFARLSATDKEAFEKEMLILAEDVENLFEKTLEPGRLKSNKELLEWWRTERNLMVEAYGKLDPKTRLPWHIPMSARSSATARLMETWAHGQDIVDTLGLKRPSSDRIKHIAHLGVSTFAWSFSCRGLAVPDEKVSVDLESPSGQIWTWGTQSSANIIKGKAEDFCLVVAQRRHYLDTNLQVKGDTAKKWMEIAQVFAGPPVEGPNPKRGQVLFYG